MLSRMSASEPGPAGPLCDGLRFLWTDPSAGPAPQCPEPVLEGSTRCILHEQGSKDQRRFWETIASKQARGDGDFRGLWFPGFAAISSFPGSFGGMVQF